MIQSTSRTVSIRDIYPIFAINPSGHSVLNRRGVMTYGWELEFPQALSLQEEDYDVLLSAFIAAAKSLPSWTVLHRQDWYFHKTMGKDGERAARSFLSECAERYFEGRPYMSHRSFIFLSAHSQDIHSGLQSGLKGMKTNPSMRVKAENIEQFEAKCDEFINTLIQSGIGARRLTSEDWLGSDQTGSAGIVQNYLQLGGNPAILSDLALGDDFISTMDRTAIAFKINESSQLPNAFSSTTPVSELSTRDDQIHLSLGSNIGLLLDCDHIVNQIIVVPSQESIGKNLESRKKRMIAGFNSNDNRINATEIAEFQDYTYINSVPAVYSHTSIIGISERGKEKDVELKISSALQQMGVTASYCRVKAPVVWYAGCPCCCFDLDRKYTMTQAIDAAFAIGSMESFSKDFKPREALKPCFRITDRLRYAPVSLDTQMLAQQMGLVGGYNAFTIGSTGSGKSFFTNLYLRQLYDNGESIFIIDVGDSYEVLTALINEESHGKDGLYFRFSNDRPITFDIFPDFEHWFDENGQIDRTEPALECFLTFLKTVWKPASGWTERVSNILADIVDRFLYAIHPSGQKPVFEDFFQFVKAQIAPAIRYESPYSESRSGETLEELVARRELAAKDIAEHSYHYADAPVTKDIFDIDDFLQSVSSYSASGRFSYLLNSREVADLFCSRFVVFEVDKLRDIDKNGTFFPVCILLILNAFDKKMREDKEHFKNLVIEEAWTAIANETMAPYVKYLYKTARKFSASINTVTQEIEDILSSDVIKNTIIQNSDVKFILDQSKNNRFGELAQMLDLSSRERALARTLNKMSNPFNPHSKDVFIKIGATFNGVYSIEASPEEAIAYESNKEKKQPLLDLAASLGSYVEAIKQMVKGNQ